MRSRLPRNRVSHERWLVSYADFITLLFSFFVVLYAFARADQKKQAQIPQSINSAFKSLALFPDYTFAPGKGKNAAESSGTPTIMMEEAALSPSVVRDDLNRIRRELEQRLSAQVAGHTVVIRMGRDGLVISLREAGFFDSGSAVPRPEALGTLHKIAVSLAGSVYDVRVEGHTDNVPIHTAQFDSNWELSSARADHIARIMLESGDIAPDRLSAAGYAEFHPVDTNETVEGRANNRRVDLVILPRTAINFAASEKRKPGGSWQKITDGDGR